MYNRIGVFVILEIGQVNREREILLLLLLSLKKEGRKESREFDTRKGKYSSVLCALCLCSACFFNLYINIIIKSSYFA